MTPEKLEHLKKIQPLFTEWNVGDRGISELGFNCFVYKITVNGTVLFIDDDGDKTNAKPYHYPYPHQLWEKLKNFKSLSHEIDTWYCEFGKGRKRNILSDTDLETALLKALVWQMEGK